jgi:hypothetical protein
MNPNLHQLQGSLTTGFIDQAHDSLRSFRPELLCQFLNRNKIDL